MSCALSCLLLKQINLSQLTKTALQKEQPSFPNLTERIEQATGGNLNKKQQILIYQKATFL